MNNDNPLKLYVWENVLCDYSCGVMFALAHDVDEARREVIKSFRCSDRDDFEQSVDEAMQRIHDVIQSPTVRKLRRRLFFDEEELINEPLCITSPEGFNLSGGA